MYRQGIRSVTSEGVRGNLRHTDGLKRERVLNREHCSQKKQSLPLFSVTVQFSLQKELQEEDL